MQVLLNQPMVVTFTSIGLATGLTSFSPILMADSSLKTPTFSYSEVGHGVYTITFTPTFTGNYSLFIEGAIQIRFQVVAKTPLQYLQSIEDEALGSWQWNKTTGSLVLLRQDGTNLAEFSVSDDMNSASRERI